MGNLHEIAIYIHGVSRDPNGRSHEAEYRALHEGIRRENRLFPDSFIGIEWGWPAGETKPTSHQLLTDAQRLLGGRAAPAWSSASDFTLNPARLVVNSLRDLVYYGFSDVMYYISQDGKQAVRLAVTDTITSRLEPVLAAMDDDDVLSLTLLGHSAGSLVAFDFLFYLFFTNPGGKHKFIESKTLRRHGKTRETLHDMHDLAQRDRLRVRRLITFGSPILPFVFRSDAVLKILANDQLLDPADYGLDDDRPTGRDLSGARWINIWDRDDPIAYPVEPLMQRADGARLVEDVYIDVSDQVTRAHDAYWRSTDVHRAIAKRW